MEIRLKQGKELGFAEFVKIDQLSSDKIYEIVTEARRHLVAVRLDEIEDSVFILGNLEEELYRRRQINTLSTGWIKRFRPINIEVTLRGSV